MAEGANAKVKYVLEIKIGPKNIVSPHAGGYDGMKKVLSGEWIPSHISPSPFTYPKGLEISSLKRNKKDFKTNWKPRDALLDTVHLPLYDYPITIEPFYRRMVPTGVHCCSYIIGQIFEAKCSGLFGKDRLGGLFSFASRRGSIKRAYRPMGQAYKVKTPDGILRFGLLLGTYVLCGDEGYRQFKSNHDDPTKDVDMTAPWCTGSTDLTSAKWPPYLITPSMGDFPVCKQDLPPTSYLSAVDLFRMSLHQRASANPRHLYIFASHHVQKAIHNAWPDATENPGVALAKKQTERKRRTKDAPGKLE